MKFVIMAGGSGSKLWPVSRTRAPKQFIKIIGEKTLFQLTIDSILKKYSIDDIFVSTTKELRHYVEEQAPEIKKENYIIEPMARDTGPAACLAMAKVASRFPDETVYFYVQAVCVRRPAEKFVEMIGVMDDLVNQHNKLVTGTIIPKYVETGSDLFKMGKEAEVGSDMKVYNVDEFVNVVKERMTLEQVTEISNKFVVGTHTNHYTWKPTPFFEAIKRIKPEWYSVLEELKPVFGTESEQEKIDEIYAKFDPARFEVITTELIKEGKVMAVVLPFDWSHITTWDDVYRYREEENLTLHEGETLEIESQNNLVMSKGKKLIALIGINDMVVIETEDSILVTPRASVSKVKEITDKLAAENKNELL